MVSRMVPLSLVLLVSLAGCVAQGAGAGNGAGSVQVTEQVPPPPGGVESIADEAAEVGRTGSEADPVYTTAREMEQAEATDGCTGAIGDADLLECNGDQ